MIVAELQWSRRALCVRKYANDHLMDESLTRDAPAFIMFFYILCTMPFNDMSLGCVVDRTMMRLWPFYKIAN
jgi:hypothetical protein